MKTAILALALAGFASLALADEAGTTNEGTTPKATATTSSKTSSSKTSTSSSTMATNTGSSKHAKVKEVSVDQLNKLIADKKVAVFDANGADTRAKYGSIPGATLLTSASQYETSLLPSDKSQKIVFYCANTRCTASDTAAQRAIDAGYKNVAVLRVGISGWSDAGQKTTPQSTATASTPPQG